MGVEDIVIPQVGEAVDEVKLLAWYKSVGDPVSEGEVLFDVDTDKTVVEIPAFADGVLIEIVCGDDSLVMPLQVVGRLETERTTAGTVNQPDLARSVVEGQPLMDLDASVESPDSWPEKDRVRVSPRARRLAHDLSIDLAAIAGSGVDGMITENDVRQAVPVDEDVAHGSREIREAIARRTATSKSTVPHFYVEMDVDFSRVEKLRKAAQQGGHPPTITAVILHACASALVLVPEVNVSYHDGELEQRSFVAVGVSVASERGLVNVTLPNLSGVEIAEVSQRLTDVTARARAFQLRPDDLAPKSLIVSNLGMYGVDAFTAIIDMPDPMILAVGRVAPRPVAVGDDIMIRPIVRLTLSVDHRAIDGERAAVFLGHVQRILEDGSDA